MLTPATNLILADHGVVGDLFFFWPVQALLVVLFAFSWKEWRKEKEQRETAD